MLDNRTSFAVAFGQVLDVPRLNVGFARSVIDDFLGLLVPLSINQILENSRQILLSEARPVAAGDMAVRGQLRAHWRCASAAIGIDFLVKVDHQVGLVELTILLSVI